jgi:hypothetical protein
MAQHRQLVIMVALLSTLAILGSACGMYGPRTYGGVTPEQRASIVKGKTTKTELLREVGDPDQRIDLGGGKEQLSYISDTYDVAPFIGETSSGHKDFWIVLDKSGVVEDFGERPTTKSHKYGGGM